MKIQAATRLKASDDNGDQERLAQLVTQIQDVEADVKEIEEDGDDATFERKHLEKLRDEQRRLKEKVSANQIKANQRLKVTAGNGRFDNIVLKMLNAVGFDAFKGGEPGVLQIQKLNEAQCRKLCNKLQAKGYQVGHPYELDDEDNYPAADGCFRLRMGHDYTLTIDPDGYVYVL